MDNFSSNTDAGEALRTIEQRSPEEATPAAAIRMAPDYPHLYEMLALHEGVRMFRTATPADLSGFSDVEVLRMIRATCGRGGAFASLADRIDADHEAILRALNAVGEPLREARTLTGQ
ncbi:hypothetical protein E4582_09880 [Luteimonas yindakuii]|uniref:Uncharacterized protein n=1 Tax=Luteimonas yindakuii TaxID=2565782 RepID=A0A4Z1RLS7_9GAMM|nr:hypothetical protein [Luteimonas yindakuii]TKS55039.1 hypothetical protein E4582_09880 [Luteimonas yindakuii]